MKRKFKILRIIGSLNPRLGGPAISILDSSLILVKQGFDIHILTSGPKKNIIRSKNIKIISKGSYILGDYYFNLKQFLWLYKNRNKYDAFIVHGIWQFGTLMARILLKKKYFVFIHGQLDPIFKKNFIKSFKKKIYWFFFEKTNLLYSKSILLTSHGEKKTLNKTFVNIKGIKKKVVQYGIIKPKINKKKVLKIFYNKFPKLINKNFYLFLGRFHEKKGCDIVIESVNKIKNKFKNKILFIGPMTGSRYEIYIKNLVNKCKLQKQILFSNAIYGDFKWGAIKASKGMILASHGENFGISLTESLSLSKPVLTTFKVNISSEILKYNAGFVSKDEINSFGKILLKFDKLNKNKLKKLSLNAFNCFKKNFDLSLTKNDLGSVLKKNMP